MSAEPKRVSFMTIEPSTDFLKKPEKEKESTAGKSKTIRLELEICEPDARNCSDFNYKRLIHIEKKKLKKLAKIPNGAGYEKANDPFGDDEDEIARIAREMEAKYGSGSSYGGKTSANDYDRGIGYDDNDSFIDNTEAYDEIIPEDVDTVRGGFYVNSGLLEFKKIPNFERPGDEIRMPKAKKRALSTSSESSDGDEKRNQDDSLSTKSKKKKKHVEKKVKSATSSSDEQGKAAKKAKKEKSTEKQKPEIVTPVIVSQTPVTKEPEKKKILEKEITDESKKVVKTTTVKDMLRLKRDNLRKLEQGKSSGNTTTTDNDEDDESESKSEIGSSLAVSESSRDSNHVEMNGGNAVNATKELSLPSTFSVDLVQMITSLKQYIDTTLKNSSNVFDNHVKEQLLHIDTLAKAQNQQVRLQVYQQLETFVPCTKKGILAKVNRYRVQQAEAKIKNEIKKLKTIVNDAMPDLVRKYDDDFKAYNNMKDMQHLIGGNESFELKSPRKKYHWNDNSRQILSDIMIYIHDLFKIMRVKKETLEEYSARYLKEHLLPLWPEGWIKLEDFHKELERKKKKEARSSQGSTNTSPQTSVNGKQSAQNLTSPHHQQQQQIQKTESRSKEVDIIIPAMNGKTTASIQLSPQSSVIKKASDHSINSIMSSSPSPPIHEKPKTVTATTSSTSVLIETKTRVIDLEKLSSPNDLLKVSQKDIGRNIPKYSQTIQMTPIDISSEKIQRVSDGSDSDCAIIDSPIKPTQTNIKPQQQQFSHHLNNNKIINTPIMQLQQQQQQGGETKKTKKQDNDYSSLIKNIASLTNPKTNSSQSFLSSPVMNDQRKMDTSHGFETATSASDQDIFFSELLNTFSKHHHEANT
ncbi:hypothetical protein PVAND_001348 [Polypedilum vanderplanki]|uniref:Uncharacterized protein n=1 Tax=Polypedilum vanderplanki TaxID=319348 RepID=A0A9J6BNZ4_POLVA|nr:hypothetical protein PVAND_001348 [Polypedilum vanderplanki]